jgi:DNA-binding FadR family transcriptional regulator
MLTAKGLLSARPGRGITVQSSQAWNLFDPDVLRWLLDLEFSLPLLRQFAQLRLAIEPEAAALAARSASDEQLIDLEKVFARMATASDAGEARDADIAFHSAILEASDNPFFRQFQPLIATALRKSIQFTKCHSGSVMSLPEHEEVFRAIADRDSAGAHEAMRKIIDGVIAVIRSAEAEGA